MAWVKRYNAEAKAKVNAYKMLKKSIQLIKAKLEKNIDNISRGKNSIEFTVNETYNLEGEYLIPYQNKRDDYLDKLNNLIGEYNCFAMDIDQIVSQCNSKITYWESRIYKDVWVPDPEPDPLKNRGRYNRYDNC